MMVLLSLGSRSQTINSQLEKPFGERQSRNQSGRIKRCAGVHVTKAVLHPEIWEIKLIPSSSHESLRSAQKGPQTPSWSRSQMCRTLMHSERRSITSVLLSAVSYEARSWGSRLTITASWTVTLSRTNLTCDGSGAQTYERERGVEDEVQTLHRNTAKNTCRLKLAFYLSMKCLQFFTSGNSQYDPNRRAPGLYKNTTAVMTIVTWKPDMKRDCSMKWV